MYSKSEMKITTYLTEEPAYTGCLAEVRGSTEWEIRYVFDSELEELRAFHEQITYMLDLKQW